MNKEQTKEYKIEVTPTIFHITVSSGVYSDYEEDHYFLRANSPEEAQLFFKKYWKDIKESDNYTTCLIFENGEHYNPFNKEDPNWDTAYGDAANVFIEMMPLIYFHDYRI